MLTIYFSKDPVNSLESLILICLHSPPLWPADSCVSHRVMPRTHDIRDARKATNFEAYLFVPVNRGLLFIFFPWTLIFYIKNIGSYNADRVSVF